VILCLLLLSPARAQAPYPTTASPDAVWGGYVVQQAVPYQPTLEGDAYDPAIQPAQWVDAQPAEPGCSTPVTPWQTYPATDPALQPVVPAAYPVVPPNPYYGDAYVEPSPAPAQQSLVPPGARNGVFQKIDFTGAYLPRFETDSLGMSDLQLDIVFGLPFFTRESPLVITPFYAVHFFDGPDSPDVPPRTHDAAATFQHFRPIGDSWIMLLDVTIGEFADDQSFGTSDALRITGGGAAVYEWSPVWKWVFGATYVDRASTKILPVAGFIYKPNDDVEYKLVFPAPKISWRLPWTDVPGSDERWLYVAGEFGGGAWAVRRTNGMTDEMDITDWRIYLGLERKIVGGISRRVEVGYVFARELTYSSMPGHISLDDTLMLRAGLTY
jgi:hypothetical protein